jgi:hypothetical protein
VLVQRHILDVAAVDGNPQGLAPHFDFHVIPLADGFEFRQLVWD